MRLRPVATIFVLAALAAPMAAASAEGGGSFRGELTQIIDAADLVISGRQVRLIGIDPGPHEALPPFEKWLRAHASLICDASPLRPRYRCVTANGVDVAEAGLLNGAGSTSDDAAPLYREREAEARQNKRGMWTKP